MSHAFPIIIPSKRSFQLGQFPTKIYRSLSGATVKRSFGNRAFGNKLNLEFYALFDAEVEQILEHYNETGGGFTKFGLPASLFAGLGAVTQNVLESTATLLWEYAESPEVTSTRPNRNDVRVTLIGELI